MESISLDRISLLHPAIINSATLAYAQAVKETDANVHPIIIQTFRSFEESDKIYQEGRTTPGKIVSWAKAGQSYHNYGLALDFALMIDKKLVWDEKNPNWLTVVECFKDHGFEWGGDWHNKKDYPHLQKTFGYNWRTLLNFHDKKLFITGTSFVKI